jgi:hypothetical protein
MNAVRVPWSSAAFLVYLGGLVILGAILSLLDVQSNEHGDFGLVFWAALVFAVLAACAYGFRGRGHFVTAGLFALSSVAAFVVFVGAVLTWFDWLPDDGEPSFRGFHFWLLVLELLTVVAAAVALRVFRFPLLVLVVAAASWYFVTDLLSGGGDWSAIVTIAFGLVLLFIAVGSDAGGSRVNAFWMHVVAAVTIGGGLLWFFRDGDFDWILIAVAGLLYIALGDRLQRSSWVVLGAWGMLQTAAHFANKWSSITEELFPIFYLFPFAISLGDGFGETHEHEWAGPLTFAVTGLVFIAIALYLARRRRAEIPAADIL